MRFYRLHLQTNYMGSQGFKFFTRKDDADQVLRDFKRDNPHDEHEDNTANARVEAIDIEPTRAGILAALEEFASHPDNG